MANAMSARLGGAIPIYRISVDAGLGTTLTKVTGGNPSLTPAGELILMLDWGPLSANSTTTFDVARVVAPLFGQTNLVSGLEGHALGEFPIHLIGHSRGGSLISELSKRLGERGIWIDHVTGLDTHPINGDAPVAGYENVLFADSYFETSSFLHLLDGEAIPGSFWRKQTTATGGYDFPFDWHSDIHLWYHGTIDLSPAASNNDDVTITSTMRDTWWAPSEQEGTNAGFVYTSAGGGDRLSTEQPNGSNSSPVRDGFNRYFDVGGGEGAMNRTPVGSNAGEWPNPIRFDLLSSNVVQYGEVATLGIFFQWAQPNTSTQSVQVLADTDLNPLNGNEVLLKQGFVTGTTMAQVSYGTVNVDIDGAILPAGDYRVLVSMEAAGRKRFLYAQQSLMVEASELPPTLQIFHNTNSSVRLAVNGRLGQTAVVQMSMDGLPWVPLVTNTLDSTRWEIVEPIAPESSMTIFRAVLVNP
jgi:hypothetical protein